MACDIRTRRSACHDVGEPLLAAGSGLLPSIPWRGVVVSGLIVEQRAEASRRSDAGRVRLSGRDVSGLLLCGEHYAAQYDLLASALGVQPARLRGIVSRWRGAGLAQTATLGPGPAWCWLTAAGMSACGLGYPARPPSLSRLAHVRAVLAVRLWLEAGQAYADGQGWWRSERKIRAALPSNAGAAHIADAEVCWPSLDGARFGGQTWAVEVELTPKPAARTSRIMSGLLARRGYAQVVYLASPGARPVVARAAAGLPAGQRGRIAIRDLPPTAGLPGALR
jgi:hypothetical protein